MEKVLLLQALFTLLIALFAFSRFSYDSRAQSTPNIYIDPQLTTVNIGSYFSVNINVTGVNQLALWQITLYYDNSILNGTLATEGSFLQQGGSTFFYQVQFDDHYNQTSDPTHGKVELADTILGNTSGANGTGTLATIFFKSIGEGNATLHFGDTQLGDSAIPPNPIGHTTTDGTVDVIGPEIVITGISESRAVVYRGYGTNITVAVANLGDFTETFNVTLCANTTDIDTEQVTAPAGNSTSVTFTCNGTGFAYGNYTLSAYAWPVSGNSTMVDGSVLSTIPGDLNGDGIVDIYDAILLASAFGSSPGSPKWNPNADINGDGVVDIYDAIILAANFGKGA
jgi:hypothetical protein